MWRQAAAVLLLAISVRGQQLPTAAVAVDDKVAEVAHAVGAVAAEPAKLPNGVAHTSLDLEQMCARLRLVRQQGLSLFAEKQEWFKKAVFLCSQVAEMDQGIKPTIEEPAAEVAQLKAKLAGLAGMSVARGCTSLLKLQHNGRVDWFETQPWYKQALDTCKAMATTATGKLQGVEMPHIGDFKQEGPGELLKVSCDKLHEATIKQSPKAEAKEWYREATEFCNKMKDKKANEISREIHEEAESALGQATKKTCSVFGRGQKAGLLRGLEMEPWYNHLKQACGKMGLTTVKSSELQERCEKLMKLGIHTAEQVKLSQVCSFLEGTNIPMQGTNIPMQHVSNMIHAFHNRPIMGSVGSQGMAGSGMPGGGIGPRIGGKALRGPPVGGPAAWQPAGVVV